MLIDMHTHMFPDALAPRAMHSLSETIWKNQTNGTVKDTVDHMREWGVDRFVALNIATKPAQQTTINNWASSIQGPSIRCFGSVHPDAPNAVDELARFPELGLQGVKLHPDYQNFFVDEPRLFPIYDAISELGLLVTFHAGKDPLSPDVIHNTPVALANVMKQFPRMKIIAAHMGGLTLYKEVDEFLLGKNIYLDTSLSSAFCSPEWFEYAVHKHGSEHILFGSDCPWSRSCDEFDYIERSALSNREKENIYWRNASSLLNWD